MGKIFFLSTGFIIFNLFFLGCSPQEEKEKKFIELLDKHYSNFLMFGLDTYGRKSTNVWVSSLQLRPEVTLIAGNRPNSIPCRVYLDRLVDAPNGATLYWDLPDIVAVEELSRLTRNDNLKKATHAYVTGFLNTNTASNGVILWGNHYYYDLVQDTAVTFSNNGPIPINFHKEWGNFHEERPHIPCWNELYAMDNKRILKHVEVSSENHFFDGNGGYNRHGDQKQGHAFLESGSVLVYSLAWLYSKTGNEAFLHQADKAIHYNWNFRNESTGLVPNSPTSKRWDSTQTTTEIGLWANNILKASSFVPDSNRVEWTNIVDKAISSWLNYGFDAKERKFYGALNVADGSHVIKSDNYPYSPGTYSNIWEPLFPTHNYPMPFAEACLRMYKFSGKAVFKQACYQWIETIKNQNSRLNVNSLLYAENYARILHFLMNFEDTFGEKEVNLMIDSLIVNSVKRLYLPDKGMFRTHTNEYRYDAVDGLGMLSLVYMWYETGEIMEAGEVFF